jgi:hypothetical protein
MKGIYDVSHGVVLRWHDICVPDLINIGTGIQAIFKILPQKN